ncbi:MAG: GlsB/YeaQ/YmgE family stress response membrane protein, partial [Prevotellaceae bacterium]|nr:GlsB/YeaQ/YmgE family stress response membrane protein [Candidatus Colivivens equi]
IIIGILAGFIASKLTGGQGKGCLVDCFLGIVGGAVGSWVFDLLNIYTDSGFMGELITGVVGAVLVLWIWKRIS